MPRLTDTEKQEILRFIDADKPLPDKYRFLLFGDKRKIVRVKNEDPSTGSGPGDKWEERWTGDYVFENEWQSFRTKKSRSLELTNAFHECPAGRRKVAVKVVDIFGNDTMTLPEVTIGDR